VANRSPKEFGKTTTGISVIATGSMSDMVGSNYGDHVGIGNTVSFADAGSPTARLQPVRAAGQQVPQTDRHRCIVAKSRTGRWNHPHSSF